MRLHSIFIMIIYLFICFIYGCQNYEKLELCEYNYAHEPEFSCTEKYGISNNSSIIVSCKNRKWYIEFNIAGKERVKFVYSDLYGPGGGGPWKLYKLELNSDDTADFVACLYNGAACGELAIYNDVVFFVSNKKGYSIIKYNVKKFDAEKINDYYLESLTILEPRGEK